MKFGIFLRNFDRFPTDSCSSWWVARLQVLSRNMEWISRPTGRIGTPLDMSCLGTWRLLQSSSPPLFTESLNTSQIFNCNIKILKNAEEQKIQARHCTMVSMGRNPLIMRSERGRETKSSEKNAPLRIVSDGADLWTLLLLKSGERRPRPLSMRNESV